MTERVSFAIMESIKKWDEIFAGTGIDDGWENCKLCQYFISESNDADEECRRCPVALDTGRKHCKETPYDEWTTHQNEVHFESYDTLENKIYCEECREIAQRERDYLHKLLLEDK